MVGGRDNADMTTRVALLEQWKDSADDVIRNQIPSHYSKRIKDSEQNTMLQLRLEIGDIIDEKMDRRFGWLPRIMEGVIQAVLIGAVLYGLGLVK